MTAPPATSPYSDIIRERWRRPRFKGDLPGATATAEDVNPLCGDRVRMQAQVADGTVEAARFTGDSCAICSASADVIAELVTGKAVDEALGVSARDVLDVLRAEVRPARMQCLMLPLTVLHAALGSRRNGQ